LSGRRARECRHDAPLSHLICSGRW
jgi:hypothetical protein